jgi:hypothetical protein
LLCVLCLWTNLIPLIAFKIPGLLVASVIGEEEDSIWRDAAQRLLQAIHETIQKRQLTAA